MGDLQKIEGTQMPATLQVGSNVVNLTRVVNAPDLAIEMNRPAPAGFRSILDGVVVDLQQDTGHTYPVDRTGKLLGLNKSFWTLVANAAGIRTKVLDRREVELKTKDGGTEPGVQVTVIGYRPRPAEEPLIREATVTMSYREGCEAHSFGGNPKARRFITSIVETAAEKRVIGKLTGIKAGYKREELTRDGAPAVFAFRRDVLDMNDPEVRRMVIEHRVQAESRLYGDPFAGVDHNAVPSEDREPERLTGDDAAMERDVKEPSDEADWEDLEPTQAQAPQQVAHEPKAQATLPYWPPQFTQEQHDQLVAALSTKEKAKIYAVVKSLPERVLPVWMAQLFTIWNYDHGSDPGKVMALWNDGKALAIQRAVTRLLYLKEGGNLE